MMSISEAYKVFADEHKNGEIDVIDFGKFVKMNLKHQSTGILTDLSVRTNKRYRTVHIIWSNNSGDAAENTEVEVGSMLGCKNKGVRSYEFGDIRISLNPSVRRSR